VRSPDATNGPRRRGDLTAEENGLLLAIAWMDVGSLAAFDGAVRWPALASRTLGHCGDAAGSRDDMRDDVVQIEGLSAGAQAGILPLEDQPPKPISTKDLVVCSWR